jgi:ATP-binding protein involved in chromosome partitioning
VQLTITQQVELDGVVVVSTPQDVALLDTIRSITMFNTVKTPIIGMVQNMSMYICPNCSTKTHIFGHDGANRKALELGIENLVNVPLSADVCKSSDDGIPSVLNDEGFKEIYGGLAKKVWDKININKST